MLLHPLLRVAISQANAAHDGMTASPACATLPLPAASGFLPHGYCYLWNKPLLLTHLISDALIGVSYVVISFALVALVHRARRDVPFHILFIAFGLFIITCGMTHFMEIWTLWRPVYWLSGGVKAVTAVASVTTAMVMPGMVPKALGTIRSARLSREREVAAARAEALQEQNDLLEAQAAQMEQQTEEAQTLAEELEQSNTELRRALEDMERARGEAEAARADAERQRAAAQEANGAKSQFLSTMSHELRTPLNAIAGYTELLAMGVRGEITGPQREDLTRIQKANQHVMSLVNDILNFAQLEGGHVAIELADVELASVITDIEVIMRPQVEARGLTFDHDACVADSPGERRMVRTDPEKLRQILLNLLTNAIKFTEARGRVSIACETDASRQQVCVRVSDTGRGIPADQLDRIFEPFVQVDRHRTHASQQGVGLGLAISRDLARRMGGELVAESTEGRGSVFTLTLPMPQSPGAVT